MLLVPALIVLLYLTRDAQSALLTALRTGLLGRVFLLTATAVGLIALIALFWRVVLALRYRPIPGADDVDLPEVTVVVPAYNEGQQVLHTLRSLTESDYPPEKVHIVAVDDGSKDDTWHWLERAAQLYPGRIALVRCPVNRGKRHALHQGFMRAKGDVLVTIDSDSEVDPAALRNLVTPLARDSAVGAVAGNVRVLNQTNGALPRMVDVSFVFSFDFLRASQSGINAVFCCPGAMAAYRRSIVQRVLPEWLDQTFLGRPAMIGEDRALTNLVLRAGYDARYQRNAVCRTTVPSTFRGLCRMYLRWGRSNVRETLAMGRFIFRRFRSRGGMLGARVSWMLEVLGLTVSQALRLPLLLCLALSPVASLTSLVTGAALYALLPALVFLLIRRDHNAIWAVPYNVLYALALWWITPYSIVTMRNSGWLTRDLPARTEPKPSQRPDPGHRVPVLSRAGTAT